MAEKNDFGKKAEDIAVEYLKDKGYEILERNYYHHKYEIDIIAKQGDTLVIVEVKGRTSTAYGEPESFVNKAKQENLIIATDSYINKKGYDLEVRFDIISIVANKYGVKVKHIEDAFYPF